ncbi:ribonucleoside-diphosphate reductase, adenosylcobalamin-dependent [Alicyclobacillus cellulosilyticus]|uniref:Vitamin B12-dependent ribonucleotide reductase n=1 Tax=Alicyclobacillus cellulosilyticus TaxID=1003997 RepID=A0A917NLW8_9BACL|nr:adenosylcobalamin-dependent ribonucleoside-diphosphate reductase [Alicyclobacillus cellulosilyticus]GGJ09993.1 ribonucleoside-diphosphate reductase, adenosylcobalamin-dependent [Alicyclobacillus cellulosilyticus]
MAAKVEQSMLPFTEDDWLGPTGERIVADRYLLKDVRKESLQVGSLVVAVLDKKRAYHELARVVALEEDGRFVTVELKDGTRERLPVQQVDVLLETAPRQMWRRIAKGAAAVTRNPAYWEERFYELQKKWRYVPGGRINASLGTGMLTTSYNCFVIPNVGPTMRDYAISFGQTLEIQARSGGVGMNLSCVPPQGTIVPVSRERRNTWLHLVLDVWHADLEDFLATEYPNSTKVVRINREFMRAVEEDAEWRFGFPETDVPGYDDLWDGDLDAWIRAGRPVQWSEPVSARALYERILTSGAVVLSDLVGTVLVPGDQRSTIAATLGDMWEKMYEGKRVNILLSSLRPRYSYVRGVNGRSSGAFSWGLLYDKGNQVFGDGFGPVGVGEIMSVGCQLTLQGGSRRGALMLILNDRHADVLKFIRCKQVDGVITGANISVGISERFMEAKAKGEPWEIGFVPEEEMASFDGDFERWRAEGKPFVTTEVIRADELWDELVRSAWKSAEPGVVFLGRANRMSNSWYFNPLVATNPCGEQPLPAYGICNLGAVVLSKFAAGFADSGERIAFADPEKEAYIRGWLRKHFNPEKAEFLLHHVRWEDLEWTTRTGLRFQDAVIDATYYPFEENRRNQMQERRVGLGIMGLHDLLIYCGIRYGSEESVKFIDVLMGLMAEWCYLESVELAKEYGPFPAFDAEKFLQSGYMQQMAKERPHVVEAIRKHGVRNVTTMTIAPTGTTGTMIGCSTGCEPYYAWSYYRNSRLGLFEEHAAIVEEYRATHPGQPLPDYFVTAMELTPEEHVRVQAALQKWIDSSISKTCNAPNSYTVEDTRRLYDLAYELGCKGITIYRDGSRSEQVLSLKQEDKQAAAAAEGASRPGTAKEERREAAGTASANAAAEAAANAAAAAAQRSTGPASGQGYVKRRRPDVLYGATYRKETPLGKAYITINDDPEEHVALEVFVNIGKAGSDVYAANEALGRAITLYLRDSRNPNKEAELVRHFSGIGGSSSVGFGDQRITSVPDAIAKSLIEHAETFPLRKAAFREWVLGRENAASAASPSELRAYTSVKDWCPQCHQHTLVRTGGCFECEACGYSKC